MGFFADKLKVVSPEQALPGRSRENAGARVSTSSTARRSSRRFRRASSSRVFGLGCFWGAERKFWQTPGVYTTAVGYAGGITPNPTYEEVCTRPHRPHRGRAASSSTRSKVSYEELLHVVLGEPRPDAGHAPGQRRRHAVPLGDLHLRRRAARGRRGVARRATRRRSTPRATATITTEIGDAPEFYYAEDYHQQYLAKNPGGYCGIGGTGVACPIGLAATRCRLSGSRRR